MRQNPGNSLTIRLESEAVQRAILKQAEQQRECVCDARMMALKAASQGARADVVKLVDTLS
jgi:hypothetical protein